jgi:hypothetical protein
LIQHLRRGTTLALCLRCEAREVTLRIEERSDGQRSVLYLSGRIRAEHLDELRAQIQGKGPAVALDLEDVTLVDVGAVHFLGLCEADGIELLHCRPYIRKWIGLTRRES